MYIFNVQLFASEYVSIKQLPCFFVMKDYIMSGSHIFSPVLILERSDCILFVFQISYKKNLIAELSREREQNLEVIQDVEREIEKQEALMYEKNISITKIHAEQKTSVEKLNRAKLSVVRSVKGIDKDSDGFKDVGLRYGRIRLQGLVQDVMRALREHPNELEIAKNYLKSDNIDIPNND